MRCKRHPSDNGVGVCAPCLRERLLALLADHADDPPHHRRKPERLPPPPPLQFPRSVSPYVCRLRSVDPAPSRLSRVYFSTRRVDPSSSTAAAGGCWRSGSGKSSFPSSLFGNSRSEKAESDSGISEASRSSSWLSVLLHGHRKKKKKKKKNSRPFAAEEEAAKRSCPARERGMSPDTDYSASGNECAPESPGSWWRSSPSSKRRPAAYHHRHHRAWGLAGFAVCLSPLMRVSPGHRRSQEAAEVGFSGELRGTLKPHHGRHVSSGAASLGPSRSRKPVDFGRFR
ncbi:uncharacterized protein [Elaeis guineensis]|uniref:Uncharacterized protein LOC105053895 n=1 Tax=Elaeis guineensis var. tenera TaxID=51953 RepID=A0A6I9RXK8_ELAGV|nr:uncharacterized protein LOC105053895 [Elaeis guineensis]